jgi:hypothetical protein
MFLAKACTLHQAVQLLCFVDPADRTELESPFDHLDPKTQDILVSNTNILVAFFSVL